MLSDSRAVFASSFDELKSILDDDVNVAVFPRTLPEYVQQAYRRLAVHPFELRATLDIKDLDANVADFVQEVKDVEARDLLETDVKQWAGLFADLVGQQHVYIDISSVSSDMCRKFHADWVSLRLLCTLAGPGTEWLRDSDVNREVLTRLELGFEEANRALMRDRASVQRAELGSVVLLKGHRWPGNEGRGAIHRSPPIEEAAERRLLLKLDTARCGC